MQRKPKLNLKSDKAYYITLTVVDWADVFTRKNHRDAIIESLKYCQKEKGLLIYAYVIMSNHLHMIVDTDGDYLIKDVIRDFKKFTSKKIIDQIKNEPESRRNWLLDLFEEAATKSNKHKYYQFWQAGNYAKEIYTKTFVWNKINYIHNNPVKAGLVLKPWDWIYSSATNYQDMESIIHVDKIAHQLVTYK